MVQNVSLVKAPDASTPAEGSERDGGGAGGAAGGGRSKAGWFWVLPGILVLVAGAGVIAYSQGVFNGQKAFGFAGKGSGEDLPTLHSCGINAHQDPRDPTVALTDQEILDDKAMKFPDKFIWGTATSAYQIEGAVKEDGRGPSIWDKFSHTPHKVERSENADIACDHYHRYKSDVALMAALGIKHYRFSISWPRIIPDGNGDVNPLGVKFYSDLVDELIKNGIEPYVTLYHWDLPLALEEKHDGWMKNDTIVPAFAKYADACFDALGDRVKTWITFNEPWCTSLLGYGIGVHAPGRKLPKSGVYRVAHNQLLAHAAAVKVYRSKYQPTQNGRIGITLNSDFKQAACNSTADKEAANRGQIFTLAWFADPLHFGDYPKEMRETAGDRLPTFTPEQQKDLKGSTDFFALNHYTTAITQPATFRTRGSYSSDIQTKDSKDHGWPVGESGWLFDVPWGFRKLLVWIKDRYDNPEILVTENGASEPKEGTLTDEESLNDPFRQRYLGGYIAEMWKAVNFDKVNIAGYFVWSFYDNFEWGDGYRPRFGIVRVNYTTMERIPKKSAIMFSKWINKFSGNQGLAQDAVTLLPPMEDHPVAAFKIPAAPITPDPSIVAAPATPITAFQVVEVDQFGPVDGAGPAAGEKSESPPTNADGPFGDAGSALEDVGTGFLKGGGGEGEKEEEEEEPHP